MFFLKMGFLYILLATCVGYYVSSHRDNVMDGVFAIIYYTSNAIGTLLFLLWFKNRRRSS